MATVNIIDLSDKFQLCMPYGEAEQPVYIKLLAHPDGEYVLTMGTYPQGMLPIEVHAGKAERWWGAKPFNAEAANGLLAKVAPLVQKYFDISDAERGEIDLMIEDIIEDVGPENVVSSVDARCYYAEDEVYLDARGTQVDEASGIAVRCEIAQIGILTAESTDSELSSLADEMIANSIDESLLVYNFGRYLQDVRSNLLNG